MLFDVSLNRDVVTWTVVLDGYVKCGDIVSAKELFDEMTKRNFILWSVMINWNCEPQCLDEKLVKGKIVVCNTLYGLVNNRETHAVGFIVHSFLTQGP
ncbi:hypothetical protein AgCh_013066 [Apium graveolens]